MKMVTLIPIEVESQSGYKADEYPKYFSLGGERFEVRQVTDRWYQGEANPEYPVSDYFKVETTGGVYIIKHDLESDRWYLCQ